MRMLAAVARQYRLRTGGGKQHAEPDLANAARRVIRMLRDGELGRICFDEQQLRRGEMAPAHREAGELAARAFASERRVWSDDFRGPRAQRRRNRS